MRTVTARQPARKAKFFAEQLRQRIIGQDHAITSVARAITRYQARLAPEWRPAGIYLLTGLSGTGKSELAHATADVLHGDRRQVLRVDCGEFQNPHEIAKLIGAPPGYLGHRETQPILTQQAINRVASENCSLSVVLLDEIEKAHDSVHRLLLGVFDRGQLKVGDNSVVMFERTLIFMTSNLGAGEMTARAEGKLGFNSGELAPNSGELSKIGVGAVRRKFSVEFLNRIDEVITFNPLTQEHLAAIVAIELQALRQFVQNRLGLRAPYVEFTEAFVNHLVTTGCSPRWGAREIKRVLARDVTTQVAELITATDHSETLVVDFAGGRVTVLDGEQWKEEGAA